MAGNLNQCSKYTKWQKNIEYTKLINTRGVRFHQHLIALPTARNTAKLPPLCSITFPSCDKSSRPLRPYLIPAALPNIAPVDIPIAKPIIAPYFTLSKQVGPRGRPPDMGMVTNYSSSLALALNLETRSFLKNSCAVSRSSVGVVNKFWPLNSRVANS